MGLVHFGRFEIYKNRLHNQNFEKTPNYPWSSQRRTLVYFQSYVSFRGIIQRISCDSKAIASCMTAENLSRQQFVFKIDIDMLWLLARRPLILTEPILVGSHTHGQAEPGWGKKKRIKARLIRPTFLQSPSSSNQSSTSLKPTNSSLPPPSFINNNVLQDHRRFRCLFGRLRRRCPHPGQRHQQLLQHRQDVLLSVLFSSSSTFHILNLNS